jgi:tetratricopeptide (TPR) repeat protein
MGKRRFIRSVFAAPALSLPLQAFCRQPPCEVYTRRAPSPQDTSTCAFVQLGFGLISKDRPKRAEKLFHIALKRTTQDHDQFLEAHAYRGLSDALFLKGEYPASKAGAEKALRIFLDLKDAHATALMRDDLGLIAIQNGDRKLASDLLNQAYSEFEALGDDRDRLRVLLGQIHGWGPDAEVVARITRADSLARALHDDSARGRVEQCRGDYAFVEGDYASALASYRRAPVFFRKSGRSREQSYVLTSLRRLYRELNDLARARQCYRAAVQLEAGAVAADSTDYTAPSSADDMAGLAHNLQSTLISYWTTQDALYIVVVDPAGRFSGARVKAGRERLRRLTALTQDASERHSFAPSEERSPDNDIWQKLYAILIEPIAAFLPQKRGALLTIIPHGPLFPLPFCALRDRNGHCLVERHATYYLPAAAVLRFT